MCTGMATSFVIIIVTAVSTPPAPPERQVPEGFVTHRALSRGVERSRAAWNKAFCWR